MFSCYGESSRKRKCVPLNNNVKKVCFNEKVDICATPSNSKEFTMANFPDHMFHTGEMIFISVNTFQKHTRVHIRVYAADDRGILHPTKSGVSLKPEVWSALHSKLSCFRPREDFESAFIIKKDVCVFNHSDKDNVSVSIQRIFQRKDSSFQFVPERVLLNGDNLDQLHDSYEPVLKCVKNKLLTYTLSEYVMAEVDRLPEIDSFYYDVGSPHGLHELFESLCKCLTKYVSNTISLFVKLDCVVCQDDIVLPEIHECMNVSKRDCFDVYFDRALYNIDWQALAVDFVSLNKNRPYIKFFRDDMFDLMEIENVFKKVEDMYVNDYALDLLPSLEFLD
ncbi:PC4 domain-containing protein [Trichonephila clavata]|uniref:PC4 domain-containing protein n=1 Tax=Trichonephila clavata TaxID=2740835 RepID=A0A8X6G053_TRICU|nr:PC4 domain-containing protein [Trichonephila clavata]